MLGYVRIVQSLHLRIVIKTEQAIGKAVYILILKGQNTWSSRQLAPVILLHVSWIIKVSESFLDRSSAKGYLNTLSILFFCFWKVQLTISLS